MSRLGHVSRVFVVWLASSAVAMTLVAVFLAPHLPPGTASAEASGQRFDNEVLTLVSVLICLFVFVFFGYALVVFRARDGDPAVDGPPVRGHAGVQMWWLVVTSVTVLFLAAFGTYELLGGAGGGQGSSPTFTSFSSEQLAGGKDPPLQVQAIAQQWQFTFRYPSEGGFESAQFVLPVNRQVELHVTSLDVIHSFWVPALGLKADANPGVDNIAYITPKHVRTVHIQCAELCGLFHGYMFDTGRILGQSAFAAWANKERQFVAPVTHYLPKYSGSYLPEPTYRAG